jgi:tetratricopeptide (TPR) repeat protein
VGDLLTLFPRKGRKGLRRATPATDWYERGLQAEPTDPAAAIAAYERAIASRPDFADAHNNLGRIHHDQHRFALAEAHYRIALCANEAIALYWFNLGVVVEDQGRFAEAIAAYDRALAIDACFADAHYNVARLYELTARRAGDDLLLRRAVRHLSAYRSLAKTAAARSREP